ncbi:MAG: hypothetical protein Q8Q31_04250 [Nanoarchaeota archaeon]|nr:hypothetical protein [Nanoarchaeota archaeon]
MGPNDDLNCSARERILRVGFELPLPVLEGCSIPSFSLLPSFYENEIGIRNGSLDLSSKESLRKIAPKEQRFYKNFLPHFSRDAKFNSNILRSFLREYQHLSLPCSVLFEDVADLASFVVEAYQLAYAHYVLGTKTNIKNSFPHYCCGVSASNLVVGFWDHGISMAMYAFDGWDDHHYLAIPFVVGKNQSPGMIVVDPTSDQLYPGLKNPPRNAVFAINGKKWSYETQWAGGKNLFPTGLYHAGSNLKNPESREKRAVYFSEFLEVERDVEGCFERAWGNPISLIEVKSSLEQKVK